MANENKIDVCLELLKKYLYKQQFANIAKMIWIVQIFLHIISMLALLEFFNKHGKQIFENCFYKFLF